jgi:hypothetical protein
LFTVALESKLLRAKALANDFFRASTKAEKRILTSVVWQLTTIPAKGRERVPATQPCILDSRRFPNFR